MSNPGLETGRCVCELAGKPHWCNRNVLPCMMHNQVLPGIHDDDNLCLARYITNLRENAEEGTKLLFEGGLDRVEDLDKVNLGKTLL